MNQLIIRYNSRLLMMKVPVWVLRPAAKPYSDTAEFYQSGKKFKVVWLLHGATCDPEDFLLQDDLLKHAESRDTMYVMPFALNSDYADHMEFAGGYPYARHFFEELMPFIRNAFPASAAREDNLIAGYSMGGAGALMLGLMRPELFSVVMPLGASQRDAGFLQPYLDLTGAQFRTLAESDRKTFPTEYGDPSWGITLKEINMIARYPTVRDYVNSAECTGPRLIESIGKPDMPEFYFCCGDKDGAAPKVEQLAADLRKLGMTNFDYELLPGVEHNDGAGAVIAHALKKYGW